MSKSKQKKGEQPSLKPKLPEPAPGPKKSRRFPARHGLAIGLMVILALLAYANSFQVPWQFDDQPNITLNTSVHLKTLSLQWLEQLIKQNSDSIRVFAYFTFALNYYFGGVQVFGYHLVNLLIHLGSGIALYGFLLLTFNLPSLRERYGSRAFPIALFSSLLFLCHPIQTQSVTYIVQRMTSLGGMFYLLAMLLYVKGRLASGTRSTLYLAGMVFSYLLGLFTKENVAILPLFIALYEFYFFQNLEVSRKGKKALLYAAGFALGIGLLMVLVWGQRYVDVMIVGYRMRDFTLTERVLTQFRVVLHYVTLLVWPLPSRLNLDYDFPTSHGILDPPATLFAILVVAGLIGFAVWGVKRQPLVSYFILWYFGNLVIESSIFPLEMVYEHRLYLPLVGPIVLFVVGVVNEWEKLRTRLRAGTPHSGVQARITPAYRNAALRRTGTGTIVPLWTFFLVLTLLFALGARDRNWIWGDHAALWEDCVKKSPNKDRPHYNLGLAYSYQGRYREAIESFQKAILLNPNARDSYFKLGIDLKAAGSNRQAPEASRKSAQLNPLDVDAVKNLGVAYKAIGSYEKSIDALREALRLKPGDADTANHLGLAYKTIGSYPRAIDVFREALRIKPALPIVLNNLGLAYTEAGRYAEAVEALKKAIQLRPEDTEAYNNLAVAYRKMGKLEEAIEAYQSAIRLDPEFPDIHNNLGLALYGLHRYQEAVKAFEQAIRLKPKEGEFHYNLAITCGTLENHQAAIQSYKEAILINPDHNRARFNLGLAYLILKKRELALDQHQALKGRDPARAAKLLSLINSTK